SLIRANFLLRAVKVPAGEHEVRFTFKPQSYYVGEKVSMGSSVVIGIFTIFYLYLGYRDKKRLHPNEANSS
ncbi:MAG TPA: hypothetical protein VKZ56_07965, partial [Membranihabitans sp.]|nr:hypothetical protein [Membranihabitans sp.]